MSNNKTISTKAAFSMLRKSNCSISDIRGLCNHANLGVRIAVARHKKTPTDVLFELAKDSYSDVRENVASNKNCDKDILLTLIEDSNSRVVLNAIGNAKTTVPMIIKVINSSKALSPALIEHCVRVVFSKKYIDEDILLNLMSSKHTSIRARAAAHDSATTKVLELALIDPRPSVRKAAAQSKNLTEDLAKIASLDTNKHVALKAIHNQNSPIEGIIEHYIGKAIKKVAEIKGGGSGEDIATLLINAKFYEIMRKKLDYMEGAQKNSDSCQNNEEEINSNNIVTTV